MSMVPNYEDVAYLMINRLLNREMQTSVRSFVELIRNLEKKMYFSKKVMDGPSQKLIQVMAMH